MLVIPMCTFKLIMVGVYFKQQLCVVGSMDAPEGLCKCIETAVMRVMSTA